MAIHSGRSILPPIRARGNPTKPYRNLHIKTVKNRDKTANIADSRAVSKGRKVRRLNPKTLIKYNYYGVNAN